MLPMSNPTSFDHSYELPLRRNLLLLLDVLGLIRFIAGVLLDRLGVASWLGEVDLPGQPWSGEHASDATLERFLEARLWETGTRSLTATRYRRRRVAQPADDKMAAEGDAEDAAAVCAICLAGLESGNLETVVELCSCSHAFHAACIDAWVGSGDDAATCPLCRARMWDDDGQSLSRARPGDRGLCLCPLISP
ncbi:E3 ubiquitin-protein ligase Os04g0590900-like [Miscanthus floridulus]|uniref:E3 ubiquitin-protein ligase Os04g0590900-like n=1 Tax=Miscanthus floridulus TaxID=154761 RepID=UPI003457F58D